MLHDKVHLVECPRDAMQGWKSFIPTEKKIEYLNSLLQVGFHTLDFGSFVSAKAIPQMADTADVVAGLDTRNNTTKLLAIIANERGARDASGFESIDYLGFPFSVSETFQLRNTNSTMADSMKRVEEITRICNGTGKELVVYLSMGFGNPYGDPYSEKIVFEWAEKIAALGVNIISVADTVGLATAQQVQSVVSYLVNALPEIEIGVHLHSTPLNRLSKIEAAFNAGCRRFDGALKGVGGCPMANDELVGNMDTEVMIHYFTAQNSISPLNLHALNKSIALAEDIFHG
jgi:hydroxymethylglutaryl-CoA lyase